MFRSKSYRVSPKQKEIMDTEVECMCDRKVTVLCESECTSPLILMKIFSPVDYLQLDAATVDHTYPIPNLEARVFALDLVRMHQPPPLC